MNVLIVDDSPDVVSGMENSVDWQRLGIDRVFTAYSARRAKEILLTETVEILLCDVEMPEEDGFSLLRWCHEQNKDVQCIFCSAYANFSYAQTALHLGSFDYLLQPAPPAQVEAALVKVIDRIDKEQARVRDVRRWNARKSLLMDACVARYLRGGMETEAFFDALRALEIDLTPETRVSVSLRTEADPDALICAALPDDERKLCLRLSSGEGAVRADGIRAEVARLLKAQSAQSDPVKAAEKYIRENIEKELRRSHVADAVFVSADHLSRLFKREKGVSLTDFIFQEKMRTAAKLLRETNVPVSLVAVKVGFTNFSYFSQSFRKCYGKAPTEYRMDCRNST